MFALKITLAVLGLLVVLQTALSFVHSSAWWVRIFDFPRPQIAGCSVLLLGLFGFANVGVEADLPGEDLLLGLLALSVGVQVWQMLPYTRAWKHQAPCAPPDVPRARRIRIVASNVRMDNTHHDLWLQTVRSENADVIIAVEVNAAWAGALRSLEADYPHRIVQAQDNTYGMAIYSRLPLRDTEIRHLVEKDVPSIFTSLELPSGQRVACVALHPRPPRPDIAQDSALRDAELARAGRIIRELQTPVVVVGDLNDVAWSHTTHRFQRIARVLDPRIGRGLFATFHADHRFFRYPLDHVFHSNHFDLVELRRLRHVGSDHFPIVIEIALRATRHDRPDVDPSDHEDEAEATEAVHEAREFQREETPGERHRRKRADK